MTLEEYIWSAGIIFGTNALVGTIHLVAAAIHMALICHAAPTPTNIAAGPGSLFS